ncbi:tetratricopeptide repeat protein [Actinomadura syzygii]|uniref:Tetratricopeptide repeat protein n=1 Tax=Actinomadura syzygii TaxID=1427538 RepID=A0A5D0UNY5_9ACTN|nr:tetratricopeptide repeat protein [Actinomadura syzygii]TYC18749.1 tetratricopeptide repeat protein [Actinomadura syzygii]
MTDGDARVERRAGYMPAGHVRTSGDRSPGIGVNFGSVRTGDEITRAAVSLPAPESVRPVARVVGLPRPATRVFVGRHDDYRRLEQVLAAAAGTVVVTQAVYGMGGVGKSELALQYADRARERYRAVWWVTAENPQQVEAGLAGLTRHLVQDAARAATTEDAAAWAVGWLRAHPEWLLVLDNVTDPAHVAGLLGCLEGGHALITSRRDVRWPGTTRTLQLGLLDPEAAAELITTISGQTAAGDRETASAIAEELGYLPLALDQAAAYIRQTRITLGRYLGLLQRYPGRYYAKSADGDKAQATIARLWDITLEALNRQAPVAAELALVLAQYAPADIPRLMLGGGDEETTEAVDEALGVLASHSMIDLTDEAVAMHRLTRAAVLSRSEDTGEEHALGAARDLALDWLHSAIPDNAESDVTGWPTWRSLIVHVEAVAALPASPSRSSERLGSVLHEAGLFLNVQGEYQRANSMFATATAIAESTLGPGHPEVAIRLGGLAMTLRRLGRAAEALPLFERALAIFEGPLGSAHPNVAVGLGNLASTYSDLGRTAEALPLLERAVVITEAALGPAHPNVATLLSNLAGMYRELGRAAEALPLLERALAVSEAAFGPAHPMVATLLRNLAATHRALGRTAETLPLQRRALAIVEAAFGPDRPAVADHLADLAVTHLDLGQAAAALPLLDRALDIAEAALGSDHPTVADQLASLAATHLSLGQATAALPLLKRALTIIEAVLGPDDLAVAIGLGNLAAAHRYLGQTADELPLLERALCIFEAVLGPDHPDIARGLGNLAAAHRVLGHVSEAQSLLERALAIAEGALGPDDPDVATLLSNLATTYKDLGRAVEALSLLERALAIAEAALGPDHPTVVMRLGNLADTHLDLGQAAAALPLLERALAIAEAAPRPDHLTVVRLLSDLATAHRDLRRAAEALAAIARAEERASAAFGAQHPTTRSVREYADDLKDLFGVPD